jgi:hypothetical protein
MRVACIQILSEIIQRSAFLKYETLELLIQVYFWLNPQVKALIYVATSV